MEQSCFRLRIVYQRCNASVYGSYLVFQFWSHTHLFKDTTTASNKLPGTVSMRNVADRLRRKSASSLVDKGDLKHGKLAHKSAKSQDSLTDCEPSTPAGNPVNSGSHPYRGSIDAYLVSPFATMSQVTVTDMQRMPSSSTNDLEAMEGYTVRLVKNSEPIRRRRPSSASDHSISWSGSEEDRNQRASPIDQDISAYLSDMGTSVEHSNGMKVSVPLKREDRDSHPEGEDVSSTRKEPRLSWTVTLLLLASIAVVGASFPLVCPLSLLRAAVGRHNRRVVGRLHG